ncbi:hypothetical protein LEMLEM_LOCUS16531, partial [Lemmus lemmus]
ETESQHALEGNLLRLKADNSNQHQEALKLTRFHRPSLPRENNTGNGESLSGKQRCKDSRDHQLPERNR